MTTEIFKAGDIVTIDYYNNPGNRKHSVSSREVVKLLLLERISKIRKTGVEVPVMWRVYYLSGSKHYQNSVCCVNGLALVFEYSLDPQPRISRIIIKNKDEA